jgi:hypothetical protein
MDVFFNVEQRRRKCWRRPSLLYEMRKHLDGFFSPREKHPEGDGSI